MSPSLRCAFDTNVLVSALLFEQSTPARAFRTALDHGSVLLSNATALELNEVLSRPKFDRYVAREERSQFVVTLLRTATLVDISEEIRACQDPKDDQLLELAVNGRADYLVSGDADLLSLHPFRGVQIVTPAAFLAQLAGPESPSTE